MNKDYADQSNAENFSLVVGGPLYQLYETLRLLKKPLLLYKRRIVFFALLTWLPLLVLTTLGGTAFDGAKVSFIHDIEVHVRFLVVLSMLVYAEVITHSRMNIIVEQFLKCNIVTVDDRPRFNRIISSIIRLRDSTLVEVALLILVCTLGHWISTKYLPIGVSTWFAVSQNDIAKLTPAGYWYVYISLPIFQFMLLRWYFRIAVWYRFLWQMSRLPLKLNSLHPDKAGGLGFLTTSIYALETFLITHTVLLSGMIFNRIWNAGATVYDYKAEITGVLIFVMLIPLIPLLFFMFQMVIEKRMGTLHYGAVANRYVNDFRQKWVSPESKNNASILGTPDIQSLADLFNSFEVTNRMRITPFDRRSITSLVVITALPLLPLILTIIPLEKIIGQIVGLIF